MEPLSLLIFNRLKSVFVPENIDAQLKLVLQNHYETYSETDGTFPLVLPVNIKYCLIIKL